MYDSFLDARKKHEYAESHVITSKKAPKVKTHTKSYLEIHLLQKYLYIYI